MEDDATSTWTRFKDGKPGPGPFVTFPLRTNLGDMYEIGDPDDFLQLAPTEGRSWASFPEAPAVPGGEWHGMDETRDHLREGTVLILRARDPDRHGRTYHVWGALSGIIEHPDYDMWLAIEPHPDFGEDLAEAEDHREYDLRHLGDHRGACACLTIVEQVGTEADEAVVIGLAEHFGVDPRGPEPVVPPHAWESERVAEPMVEDAGVTWKKLGDEGTSGVDLLIFPCGMGDDAYAAVGATERRDDLVAPYARRWSVAIVPPFEEGGPKDGPWRDLALDPPAGDSGSVVLYPRVGGRCRYVVSGMTFARANALAEGFQCWMPVPHHPRDDAEFRRVERLRMHGEWDDALVNMGVAKAVDRIMGRFEDAGRSPIRDALAMRLGHYIEAPAAKEEGMSGHAMHLAFVVEEARPTVRQVAGFREGMALLRRPGGKERVVIAEGGEDDGEVAIMMPRHFMEPAELVPMDRVWRFDHDACDRILTGTHGTVESRWLGEVGRLKRF